MRLNYIGIIGGILALISLALPWWTMAVSTSTAEMPSVSGDISVYLYRVSLSMMGMTMSLDLPMSAWYYWAALALVIIGGILGILGSIIHLRGKMMLAAGGALALLSIIIFAVGLQDELSRGSLPVSVPGGGTIPFPSLGLFSSGSYMGASYSCYLSFGFWIALIAAILMFAAIKKAEGVAPTPTPVAAPPPPP